MPPQCHRALAGILDELVTSHWHKVHGCAFGQQFTLVRLLPMTKAVPRRRRTDDSGGAAQAQDHMPTMQRLSLITSRYAALRPAAARHTPTP